MSPVPPERAAVEAALPHRPPFLFVDRVVERAERSLVAEWHVAADLDVFRGHYPGRPLLPGVLICEFAVQSAALLFAGAGEPGQVPVLTRLADARFRRPVLPGATLRAAVELEEAVGSARYCRATVTQDGAVVLRARFTVAVADAAALGGAEAAG